MTPEQLEAMLEKLQKKHPKTEGTSHVDETRSYSVIRINNFNEPQDAEKIRLMWQMQDSKEKRTKKKSMDAQ